MTQAGGRIAGHPIDPLFLLRWSPRAFDGSAITEDELMVLLEAARWAPSAYNLQPWRFSYALNGDAHWGRYVDALIPFNQGWADKAAALVFIVSDTQMRDVEGAAKGANWSHSFDAGAAWAQLALQASMIGLAAHAMTGFEESKVRHAIDLPADYRPEAAVAIGRVGDPASLDAKLRDRETPSGRRSMEEVAFAGFLSI